MDFAHIYELHKLLSNRRYPIPINTILNQLEWSKATFYRVQQGMKDYLGAPIKNKRGRGYFYDLDDGDSYELPGLWFSAKELIALGVIEQLSESFQPATVKQLLAPFKKRLDTLLRQQQISDEKWQSRIKIINHWHRSCEPEYFNQIAYALLHRQQLNITYWQWSSGNRKQRVISPQRLIYYRDNWYLDAWCHLRQDLRTFSVDAIQEIHTHTGDAIEIPTTRLDDHVLSGYGIFAGHTVAIAKLKFSKIISKRVSMESWHPEQCSSWSEAGNYLLEIPYSDHLELLHDILHYGADVEVISPSLLRQQVQDELDKALKKYL